MNFWFQHQQGQLGYELYFVLTHYVSGGELFTHLNQQEQFVETDVRIYIGEICLALETLHKVSTFEYKVNLTGYN